MPVPTKAIAVLFILLGCYDLVTGALSYINVQKLSLSQNILGIFVGIGILRLKRAWRTCGLILLWINVVAILLSYAVSLILLPLFFSKMGVSIESILLSIVKNPNVATIKFLVSLFMLILLGRGRTKEYFLDDQESQGKVVPLFTGALIVMSIFGGGMKVTPYSAKSADLQGGPDKVSMARDKFDFRFNLGHSPVQKKTVITGPVHIEPGSMGYIRSVEEDVTLTIRDAVSVWSERDRKLSIHLFTEALSEQEKEALLEYGSPAEMHRSLLKKNEQMQKMRYGQVDFTFTQNQESKKAEIKAAGIAFSYMTEVEGRPTRRGASVGLLSNQVKETFDELTINETVKFKLQYQRELAKKNYMFVLNVETPIVTERIKPDGIHKTYYEAGVVRAEYPYKNGVIEGESKYFYDTGELQAVQTHTNGKINGKQTYYYKNGNLKLETMWVDGRATGISKEYYVTGELMANYHYNGFVISKMEFFDKKGKPISREQADQIQKADENPAVSTARSKTLPTGRDKQTAKTGDASKLSTAAQAKPRMQQRAIVAKPPNEPATPKPSVSDLWTQIQDKCRSELGLFCTNAKEYGSAVKCLAEWQKSLLRPCREALAEASPR